MDNRFSLTWEITNVHEGQVLRDFLLGQQISKGALTEIKYHGGEICVNGAEVTVRYLLKNKDVVIVRFPKEKRSEKMLAENIPLDIIFEDEYLLVIKKTATQNTIPSREHPQGSVANALLGYYEQIGIHSTAHIVTRLDRDTSGLILVAKHRHVHHLLSKQQRRDEIQRVYEAIVTGSMTCDNGAVEEPIARKESSIIEREVHPAGQYACTHYKVLHRYDNFTHVQLQLETGRTHQIRVHLAYIGHPLLGDTLYGNASSLIARQALHCKKIAFYHPITGKYCEFYAPLPNDMKKLLHG